jgi:hypothetical protein
MNKTVNDIVREVVEGEGGLSCVPPSEWEWEDCNIKGHEVECYMAICPACGFIDRDCENK